MARQDRLGFTSFLRSRFNQSTNQRYTMKHVCPPASGSNTWTLFVWCLLVKAAWKHKNTSFFIIYCIIYCIRLLIYLLLLKTHWRVEEKTATSLKIWTLLSLQSWISKHTVGRGQTAFEQRNWIQLLKRSGQNEFDHIWWNSPPPMSRVMGDTLAALPSAPWERDVPVSRLTWTLCRLKT